MNTVSGYQLLTEDDGVPMELHFTRTNGQADEAIEALMDLVGGVQHRGIVREMIVAALKAGQEAGSRADLKLMNTTLKEMRFTTKVFGPYRGIRKVTVFGSARTATTEPSYRLAHEFGRALAEAGLMVITGGGSGIMQAVNEGAGPAHSFGVNIRLPFEQTPNHVLRDNPRLITYKYFFNRKVAFLKESDAIVLFPGGFGTLDEAMETLTLVQTGKHYPVPLILLEPPGGQYWARAIEFFESELRDRGYVSDSDLGLFEHMRSAQAALEKIQCFYSGYHSMRDVGDQLVIRLNRTLGPEAAVLLTRNFADLLRSGGSMTLRGPLPAEFDEPDIVHLPRLVVDFNHTEYGRLRGLIDAINRLCV
jgi:uncharacterized protein (TIGR00730 family)